MLIFHQNDVGKAIEVDMGEDISTATGVAYHVKKPSGDVDVWTPVTVASGETDVFTYTLASGDLDESGDYELQPAYTKGAWTGFGLKVPIRVIDSIESE